VRYQIGLEGIDTGHLDGFFEGWPNPPSRDKHLALLRGSSHIVLARERNDEPLVGFVAAVSDGVLSAYISFLEVRPKYRGRGVGTELVTRLLALVDDLYMIDVMCDLPVRPFYERLGFTAAPGAAIRRKDCATLRR